MTTEECTERMISGQCILQHFLSLSDVNVNCLHFEFSKIYMYENGNLAFTMRNGHENIRLLVKPPFQLHTNVIYCR
jgi:hypothetical protein